MNERVDVYEIQKQLGAKVHAAQRANDKWFEADPLMARLDNEALKLRSTVALRAIGLIEDLERLVRKLNNLEVMGDGRRWFPSDLGVVGGQGPLLDAYCGQLGQAEKSLAIARVSHPDEATETV